MDTFQSSPSEIQPLLRKADFRFQSESFQSQRLKASVKELLRRYPESSAERDPILLRVLARESVTSGQMRTYRHLLHSPESKCEEHMTHLNGPNQRTYKHPHNGKTFDELCGYLDSCQSALPKIRKLAKPLPQNFETLYRRTKQKHKDREAADGKFDFDEVYARGFPLYISAVYCADDPRSIVDFGDAEETLKMKPGSSYIDLHHDKETVDKLEAILEEEGLSRERFVPLYDLIYKSGIEVCLYRTRGTANWFNVYNPEVVTELS